MRQAVLSVDHETLAEYGFAVFQDAGLLDIEILSCEGPRGVSRIHVEEQLDEHRLDELKTIQWWECVADEGSKHVYLVEMNVAEQLDRVGVDADVMTRTEWAEVHSQGFSFEQTGSQEELSAMLADLQAAGQNITLEKLQDYRIQETPMDVLTDRQHEVLDVAYELGYYDVPRKSSTAEVAADLGVDDSTVSEHLQRAEHNLLESLLG
ncbi:MULTISPECIES: helix-turn-helix domain-containing protein [Halobacteriales]|uniref:helix-turn-helix domain-containing protein n=1 Tax=Halobacteriales TaxID=2235 RepID=UPI001E5384A7|nr:MULTISPECIES: helix-turn-helix domain-containing protein [Halobacteriales]USZ78530.1 helix-turn-helix domain-containing protein [Halorussus vallis]